MTPVISDGLTNGSKAMRYSLISRDYIADCIEVMHEVSASNGNGNFDIVFEPFCSHLLAPHAPGDVLYVGAHA